MGERRRKFNDKEVFTKLDTTRVYPSRVAPPGTKKEMDIYDTSPFESTPYFRQYHRVRSS